MKLPAFIPASGLLLLFLFSNGLAAAQELRSPPAFFPARPHGVESLSTEGVLLDFNIGNISGGILLQQDGKEIDFYTALGIKIDGKAIKCLVAPTETYHPDLKYCPDWPADIHLGKTQVKVAYWLTEYEDKKVKVADSIDALR